MTIVELEVKASVFLEKHICNYINETDAIREDLIGMKIYDSPIFSVGSASDPLFDDLRKEDVVGVGYKVPNEWVSEANSVISYFLPYTNRIKRANAMDMSKPIDEWYHARIEGQEMMNALGEYIKSLLENSGYESVVPSSDHRFEMIGTYNSNWSERHTAYICGLGTFSLMKGLITKIGTAGRFGSVVTSYEMDVTKRDYTELYEYCSLCGVCAKNCPINSIDVTKDLHTAKSHKLCDKFCLSTNKIFICGGKEKLRYGCGKCQVNVPCENKRAYRP